MHFIVSWDIFAEGETRATIQKALDRALAKHAWVRPLTTFYIVPVSGLPDYQAVTSRLMSEASAFKKYVNMAISPPITMGTYSGYLPQELWNEIARRIN